MLSDGNGQVLPMLALVGQLGLIMIGCILGGFLGGTLLDRRLNSSPVLTIILLLVGVAAGMVAVYRLVMKAAVSGRGDEDRPAP